MVPFITLPTWAEAPIALGRLTLPFSLAELVILFALPVLGVWLGIFLVRWLLRRLIRRRVPEEMRDRLLHWLRVIVRLSLVFTFVAFGSGLLGAELVRWTASVIRILNQPIFTSGNTEVSIVTLILVVPVFYLAGWLSRLTREAVEHGLLKRLNLDASRHFSILSVVRFAVSALTVVVGLSVIGINLSSLAVLFGVLGIGVGFGLQDVVGNLFAGLVIIFSRPVKEGDRVLVDGIEGTVQQIKVIHTVVNTITHETIIIPNSKITGNSMHNYSYDDERIIVINTVQVSYGSDLDRVGQVLLEVGARNPWRVAGKQPFYQVWSFDDSGITVRLGTWIASATDRIAAFAWTNLELWRAFKAAGVEIPFPQMDLHVKNVPDARATLPES